jgi:nitric oxide reductase NorE protein
MTQEQLVATGHDVNPASDAKAARRIPAEPGIWILLFGDMLVFSTLFVVYLRQRSLTPDLFAHSQDTLDRTTGAVNTVVLLTSSLLVVLATSAAQRGDIKRSKKLLFGGAAVGSLFILLKAHEYHEMIAAGLTPSINGFFMYYFVLTGLHLAHVALGLILLFALAATTRGRPSSTRLAFVEGGACFWHMVDLLWLIIFPLIFLVR